MIKRFGKNEHFRQLIKRIDDAKLQGFYLECLWLEYAFLEGRLDSVISKAGIVIKNPKAMFGTKIQAIKDGCTSDSLLSNCIGMNELEKLTEWKDKRNALMHKLADDLRPWSELNAEIEILAEEGSVIARSFAASIRRYKKQWKKQNN